MKTFKIIAETSLIGHSIGDFILKNVWLNFLMKQISDEIWRHLWFFYIVFQYDVVFRHCNQSSLYIRCVKAKVNTLFLRPRSKNSKARASHLRKPMRVPRGEGLLINCNSQWNGCKLKFWEHPSTIRGYIFKYFMLSLYYLSLIPPQYL